MKKLLMVALIAIGLPFTACADSFKAGVVDISGNLSGGGIAFYVPGLDFVHESPGQVFIFGAFTKLDVTTLTCANAGCTGYNVVMGASGLTMSDVSYKSVLYPTVYLSGILDLTARFVSSLPFELGQVSGAFLACADPSCTRVLFSLNTNVQEKAVFVVIKNGGNLTLDGFSYAVPEPSTLGLLGTGILGIAGVLRRKMVSRN